MQRRSIIVAIDGPSGSGKSTVARTVAGELGLRYLDSGAMYRALTWLALDRNISLDDAAALSDLAATDPVELGTDPTHPTVTIAGVDVTAAVRSAAVTAAVSAVSAIPGVRAALLDQQRALIGAGDVVVEGRDIGVTVAPDAQVKVFLTADADVRASRRTRQDGSSAVATTRADLLRRDASDSARAASPLAKAADAIEIDSSVLGVAEVATVIRDAVDAALAVQA